MPNWVTERITSKDVCDAETFAQYCHQTTGTPYPTAKSIAALKKQLKDLFEQNPRMTWPMLCRVVDYTRTRRRRIPHAYQMLNHVRYAWAAGILPELDPAGERDEDVERGIAAALDVETDPEWRGCLLGSRGVRTRREVLSAWKERAVV